MMKIISVERADADRLADSFFGDLLYWGAVPQRTAPLPEGWRGAYQDQLNQVVSIFRRAYADDRESLAVFRLVETEARDFITVLAANPALALKPADSEWPEGYALNRYRGLNSAWESLKALRIVAAKDPPPDDTAAALVTVKMLACYAGVTIEAVKLHIKGIDAIQGDANKAKQYRYSDVLPALKHWSSSTRNTQTHGIQWPEDPAKLSDPAKLPPKLPARGKPRKTR
jgi:hypothetical protein